MKILSGIAVLPVVLKRSFFTVSKHFSSMYESGIGASTTAHPPSPSVKSP